MNCPLVAFHRSSNRGADNSKFPSRVWRYKALEFQRVSCREKQSHWSLHSAELHIGLTNRTNRRTDGQYEIRLRDVKTIYINRVSITWTECPFPNSRCSKIHHSARIGRELCTRFCLVLLAQQRRIEAKSFQSTCLWFCLHPTTKSSCPWNVPQPTWSSSWFGNLPCWKGGRGRSRS